MVSVIMPAYNASEFIEEAINSVISQTFANWELLVIDDCSTDNTVEIVEEIISRDKRVKLLRNYKNIGTAGTRNRGLDAFSGEYVALLDSDDFWYPQMLEKMVTRAQESKADIIYCSYALVDEKSKKICNDFVVPEKTSFRESLARNVISCSTALLTGDLAKRIRFPTNVYHEDLALWLQLLREGIVAIGVTDVLAAYRQRADSRSANKIKSAVRRWDVCRRYLKMSFMDCVFTTLCYGYYGIKKFWRI